MRKVLIIGGCSQGKTEFGIDNFKGYVNILGDMDCMDNDFCKGVYEGVCKGVFLDDFHLIMKGFLENGCDYQEFVRKLVELDGWVVICNEIGSGIVPIDKRDRKWREQTGRMLTEIARGADEVYRVFSGIPQRIK